MLDENVANSVAIFLKGQKYECEYIRDLLPAGAVDQLVAFVAEEQEAILVSHDGNFQKIAPRIPDGQKTRFKALSRIKLNCPEMRAASRIEQVLQFIVFEYEFALASPDKRMNLIIGKSYIRSDR